MTTVPVTIAGTNQYQNLVVKDRVDLESASFRTLTSRTLDAETGVFDTLNVTNLNQSSGISANPFAGVSLAPSEMVALTATKALTTVPYSQSDLSNSLIQRGADNSVTTRFIGVFTDSAQIVLGPGPTTTLTATQNGYSGGIGVGGVGGDFNMVLSGSSSVINSSVGNNRILITDSSPSGMFITTFMEAGAGQESAYAFSKAGTEYWRLSWQDATTSLELRHSGTVPYLNIHMDGNFTDPIDFQGNIFPFAANTYALGSNTLRFDTIFLTTQTLTGIGASANFTNAPATGLGTTTALTTVFNATESVTFTNTNLMASSPILFGVSAYSGTTGIPLAQYDRGTNSFIIANVSDSPLTPLNGTVTASFVIVNANGTGP